MASRTLMAGKRPYAPRAFAFEDVVLEHLRELAGNEVNSVVIAAYTEIEELRAADVELTPALTVYTYRKHLALHTSKRMQRRPRTIGELLTQRLSAIEAAEEEKRLNRKPPVVYFIRWGSRIKVGYTNDIARRVSELSLTADCVLLTIPGDRETEGLMHMALKDYRIGNSEWFDATDDVLDFIEVVRDTFT